MPQRCHKRWSRCTKWRRHWTIAPLAILWAFAPLPALGDGRTATTATAQGVMLGVSTSATNSSGEDERNLVRAECHGVD